MTSSTSRTRSPRRAVADQARLLLERIEDRLVPAAAVATTEYLLESHAGSASPDGSAGPVGLTPAQIRTAYGFDAVLFGSVVGDGSGQTIAIVDAYDDPKFVSSTASGFSTSDLHNFDAAFGLPDPVFTKVNQSGGTSYPAANSGWGTEIALDVEWAHVVAPKASILLVEASSASYTDLFAAVNYAKTVSGVSVVSMSWGGGEFSGETSYDSSFATPTGHGGVTFLASTGDSAAPGGYPAYSPRVVAVGGTRLTLGTNNAYAGESGWADGGGGISTTEAKPAYQSAITLGARRMIPDVALDADPNSGVAVYDSNSQGTAAPWIAVGGTSLAAPMWAGLIAVANQGRAVAGQGSLDGYTQTLPMLYALPAADFHDVTTGNNGFAAGTGYDLVTGLGTPIANLVANGLVGTVVPPSPPVSPPPVSPPPVSPPPPTSGTYSYPATGLPASILDNRTTTSSVSVPADLVIGKVTVTLNLTHTYDSDLVIQLVSPSGRVVTLSNRHGGSGDNYTNTVFDSTAAKTIASGSAPFTGTYAPDGSLAVFNGLDAKGTWTLKVSDVAAQDQGSLRGWTLTVQGTSGTAGPATAVPAGTAGAPAGGAGMAAAAVGLLAPNGAWFVAPPTPAADHGATVAFTSPAANPPADAVPITAASAVAAPFNGGTHAVSAAVSELLAELGLSDSVFVG